MKKVIIIGGGISGLTAGILLQKKGFKTVIYEKNNVIGGLCSGWKKDGYFIDNCIHWLTGTNKNSSLYKLWEEVGALGNDVNLYEKEMMFRSKLNGEVLTFWRDKERTRKEMLELSITDSDEINKFIDAIYKTESMSSPVDKPFDKMKINELLKLVKSVRQIGEVMKEYKNMDLNDLAKRFKHPLIRQAFIDYIPSNYQAIAFISSYGTITSGNGDVPKGGSLQMAMRMKQKYQENGGSIIFGNEVKKINLGKKKVTSITLDNGEIIDADYVICACDPSIIFSSLLDASFMPKGLKKMYKEREKYPVNSAFQIAFGVDGKYDELTGTTMFTCDPITIGKSCKERMSVQAHDFEPTFSPDNKMIIQSSFVQNETDYAYWESLFNNPTLYNQEKERLGNEVLKRLLKEYPYLKNKVHILDVWTPVSYVKRCKCYHGAYMSFVMSKYGKRIIVPGKIKKVKNIFLASQWLMAPGGLPTAVTMGKFAAWRVINDKSN